MQQSRAMETWVGVFVAMGFVSLFFLAMQVSNLAVVKPDAKSYRVTARFQNIGGLKARATVSMAGVRVGRVSRIRFDKESYEAVVDMLIDPEYDTVPTDTTANILTQGLLGEQYVGLSPGAAEEFLKDGDQIELTQSALILEEVISRFLFNKAESSSEHKPSAENEAAKVGKDEEPVADGEAQSGDKVPAQSVESSPAAGATH